MNSMKIFQVYLLSVLFSAMSFAQERHYSNYSIPAPWERGIISEQSIPQVNITGKAAPPEGDMVLWYREPQDLTIGTGRLMGVVRGLVRDEVIAFNDETLYTGQPYNPVNPEGIKVLPEIRKLMLNNKYEEAFELCQKLESIPQVLQIYQPMGKLRLNFKDHNEISDYRFELDLENAIVRTVYRIGSVHYKREVFASYPDQVIVMRITADQPGQISLTARLDSVQPSASSKSVGNDQLVMSGDVVERQFGYYEPSITGRWVKGSKEPLFKRIESLMKWESRLKVSAEGGTVSEDEQFGGLTKTTAQIRVENANEVTLVLCGATNYERWNDISADPTARCDEYMKAANQSWEQLLKRHLDDYQPQFNACGMYLGRTDGDKEDMDTRTENIRKDGFDPHLVVQQFQRSRYNMLTTCRPGTLIPHHDMMQTDLEGFYQGRWTNNEGIMSRGAMNEVLNLPETIGALMRFAEFASESGARTAKELYGCRGWVMHHGTDIWMNTAPQDGAKWGLWPGNGAWICWELWEHYQFDPDPEYLKKIYPILKGSAEFFMDYMITEPKHGWLVTCPSNSPETVIETPDGQLTSIVMGPTIDNQLLRALFDMCMESARVLNVDKNFSNELRSARKKLPPDQIGRFGQIQEFIDDWDQEKFPSRHLSQTWGWYPGNQITLRGTPELAKAVRVTFEPTRADGLSYNAGDRWGISRFARFGDAEKCEEMFRGGRGRSDFIECLLQSHAGEIDILPALPKSLPEGSIWGLRARGGYGVDIDWNDGRLLQVVIRSKYDGTCRLHTKDPVFVKVGDEAIERKIIYQKEGDCLIEFETVAGGEYYIYLVAETYYESVTPLGQAHRRN